MQSRKSLKSWVACDRNILSSLERLCQSPPFRLDTGSKDFKTKDEYLITEGTLPKIVLNY